MSGSDIFQGIIVPGFVLCPIGIACRYHKRLPNPFIHILIYLVFASFINLVAVIFSFYHINNLPLLHIYTFAELVLLLEFYKKIFVSPAIVRVIYCIQLSFPVLCIINFQFFQSIYTFNTYTRPLAAIIIIVFSLFHIIKMNDRETFAGSYLYGSLVSIGLLIYFASSLVQFALSNYVLSLADHNMNMIILNIHDALVLFMYVLFSIDFYYAKAER